MGKWLGERKDGRSGGRINGRKVASADGLKTTGKTDERPEVREERANGWRDGPILGPRRINKRTNGRNDRRKGDRLKTEGLKVGVT
jgi:hypothetical protein